MASKQLINSVDTTVEETLAGLCCAYPQLEYHPSKRVVLAANYKNRKNKVSIICGGGSGHEPFAAGFVGAGMLTASIAGSVFAAPPPNNILHALNCVSNDAGTLVVIPNYTGDCLNFGITIEKARQKNLKIAEIIVGDDCSIPASDQGRAGKRGLVGLLFVIKITGAMAERGNSIDEILYHAKVVADCIATYGVGLRSCSLPGQGLMMEMPADEIEIGLGIHGEAGYHRIKIKSASEVITILLETISETLSLNTGDSVAVLVNNFGGTSQLEQGIVINEIVTQLRNKNINVCRVYSGVLMTSLDSAGVHVSVLKLPEEFKKIYLDCLDDKTDAPCWPGCAYTLPTLDCNNKFVDNKVPGVERTTSLPKNLIGPKISDRNANILKECLLNACKAIINNEETLNTLDRGCGDGDCGSTHKKLADSIVKSLDTLSTTHPVSLLTELSEIAEDCMGGTSGAVYSLIFTTAASALPNTEIKAVDWGRAWKSAINGVTKYSKAQPGDRTMLDALDPACMAFNEQLNHAEFNFVIKKTVDAAKLGCNLTKQMIPKAGRAAYVKQSKFLNDVDAGAFGVVIWISAIAEILMKG
ncbi:triokinase/FMN cyclase-like [Cotesia glomerata]|nr:triokinase/FMN cyclase-like [Cotesia glomerata]XP_044590100.1 triokinase/FMN cyclase-like [Cotesia glomerata]XP_044590102.1 triokinase/FMN cyclase-like [Cotesia glomerata]